jgi:hypothetical protein
MDRSPCSDASRGRFVAVWRKRDTPDGAPPGASEGGRWQRLTERA